MTDRSTGSPSTADDAPTVERCIDIAAPLDDVWRTLTDPDELARWLDAEVVLDLSPGSVGRVVEPDGTVRQVLVTQVEPGHLLAWHWWEDGGELSTVEITAMPIGDDTRVRVIETMAAVPTSSTAQACAGRAGLRWQQSLTMISAGATFSAGALGAGTGSSRG